KKTGKPVPATIAAAYHSAMEKVYVAPYKEEVEMNENANEFRKMVQSHDMTYTYSDDSRTYNKGDASYKAIQAASKKVPGAAKIWNSEVDKKIMEPHRKDF